MKSNELRIGNYVHEPSYDECYNTYVIKQIQTRGCSISVLGRDIQGLYDYEDLSPIPLTEEWLVKFGFLIGWIIEHKETYFPIQQNGDEYYYSADEYHFTGEPFKYVHQLQNLYFALTGKELTIKE